MFFDVTQVADDFVRIGNAIRTIPPVRTLALSTLMTNTAVASNATGVAPAGAGGAGVASCATRSR